MNRGYVILGALFLLIAFGIGNAARHRSASLAAYDVSRIHSPRQFNDLLAFKQKTSQENIYVYDSSAKGNVAHLRFVIPGFDPSAYRLSIRLKARSEILKASKVRTANDFRGGVSIIGDVATYDIPMADAKAFLWTDGRVYVGVSFPRKVLRPGDTVELLDFKFSLL